MRTFRDRMDREWEIDLNVAALKRVRGLCSVDLMEAPGGELLAKLADDPAMFVDVLYAICKPQADERGITDEQFGAALGGQSVANAMDGFLWELADFFPDPARRRAMQMIAEKTSALQTQAAAMVEKRLSDPAIDRMLADSLNRAGELLGSALGSAASIPDHSSSGS